jgi:spectinomycin phosphotransferase
LLEKPDLDESKILGCLRREYGLDVTEITFLPLGADRNTAVYRAVDGETTPYFVKLRRGAFHEPEVLIPRLLHDQGVTPIIAPLPTPTGQLWASLADFTVAVFPFVEGRDGYEIDLGDDHWVELGRALRGMHAAVLPAAVTDRLLRESFSPHWRGMVRDFRAQAGVSRYDDAVADALAVLLRQRSREIDDLLGQAHRLAELLRLRSGEYVLCHGDIHAGNVLIETNGALHVVDWDTLILAPKERDLMFVGGGQFGSLRTPAQEEALFYQGYGPTSVDPAALAYYRCERIVQDIAAYCEQIFLTAEGADRAEGLRQLTGQFLPGGVVEIALASVTMVPPGLR